MPSRYAHDGFPTLRARLTSKLGTLMSGGEKWTGLNRLRAEWITIRNGIELLILSNIISREHREMGLQPEIKNWSACKAHTSAERLIPVVTARLLGCLIRANSNEFFGTLSSRLTTSRTRLWSGTLVVRFAEMEAATRDTTAV